MHADSKDSSPLTDLRVAQVEVGGAEAEQAVHAERACRPGHRYTPHDLQEEETAMRLTSRSSLAGPVAAADLAAVGACSVSWMGATGSRYLITPSAPSSSLAAAAHWPWPSSFRPCDSIVWMGA